VEGADADSASLILLRGPAASRPGEIGGAIDVTAGGRTVPVETIGYAVFVPTPDHAPIGPFLLSDEGLAQLAVLLGDPRGSLAVQPQDPLAADPLTTGTFDFVDY